MDSELPFDHRVPPSFILSAASNILPKKKITVVEEVPEHSEGLLPILLRSDPLPQLPPDDVEFALRHGARNIIKRRRKDLAKHVQEFRVQPNRATSAFADETAIESDGAGRDIPSRATTNPRSSPPSPLRTPISLPIQVPIEKKTRLKKPKEDCKLLGKLVKLSICNKQFSRCKYSIISFNNYYV